MKSLKHTSWNGIEKKKESLSAIVFLNNSLHVYGGGNDWTVVSRCDSATGDVLNCQILQIYQV